MRLLGFPLWGNLVAIVCAKDSVCQEAQSQMTFGGDQRQQSLKAQKLRFATVRQPPTVWWAYAVAGAVVVACPLAQLAPEQRGALEGYLRQGGRLVLVKEEAKDPSFLAPYRLTKPDLSGQAVGMGRYYEVRSLESRELESLFTGAFLELLPRGSTPSFSYFDADEAAYVLRRLATAFVFPGLGWLLLWLLAYVLVVGLVNFTLLSRLRRREWGWVTIPVLAVLFAGAFYAGSAAKRPKKFALDEVSVYWMDDRSPLAATQLGVRASAPKPKELFLAVSEDAILAGDAAGNGVGVGIPLGIFTSQRATALRSYSVRLGTPQQVALQLLQWSFKDFGFRQTKRLPGTIRRLAATRLRNETGQAFADAIYVDKRQVYFLGAVPAGADIDLTKARQEALKQHTGRRTWSYPTGLAEMDEPEPSYQWSRSPEDAQKEFQEARELPHRPFAPLELIRGWPKGGGLVFSSRSALFFGLAEKATPICRLMGEDAVSKSYAVVIVSFGSLP